MSDQGAILLIIRDMVIEIDGQKIFECDYFVLREGDKILLTSASGAGKSLFLRCLSGLLDVNHVKQGWFIFGHKGKCRAVGYEGYVRQNPLSTNTTFVFQDAMNSLHPYRAISKQLGDIKISEADGIGDLLDSYQLPAGLIEERRFSRRMSGGECQRVSLMHVHNDHKSILFLDEPLTDIDRISRFGIEKLLKEFLECDNALTVILVTHDTDWIEDDCHDAMRHITISDLELREFTGDEKQAFRKERDEKWKSVLNDSEKDRLRPQGGQTVFSLRIRREFGFAGRKDYQIWKSPQIEIGHAEVVGLLGESGSGKSVLLRCIAGLQSKAVLGKIERRLLTVDVGAQGRPEFRMQDLSEQPVHQVARNIQYVFQNNKASVIGTRTVFDDLEEIKRNALDNTIDEFRKYHIGFDPSELKSSLDRIAESYWKDHLKISARTWQQRKQIKVRNLSLGMLRRYNILRALIKLEFYTGIGGAQNAAFDCLPDMVRYKPRILLADEISRGLDQNSLLELVNMLKKITKEIGLSVVLVSHELPFIQSLADRVFVVVDGFVMPTPLDGSLKVPEEADNPYYEIYLGALARDEEKMKIMEKRARLVPPPRGTVVPHTAEFVVKQIFGERRQADQRE